MQTTKTSISFSGWIWCFVIFVHVKFHRAQSFGLLRVAVWHDRSAGRSVGRSLALNLYKRFTFTNELGLSRCFQTNELQFYLFTHLQIIISPFLVRSCVIHKFFVPDITVFAIFLIHQIIHFRISYVLCTFCEESYHSVLKKWCYVKIITFTETKDVH